MKKATLFILAIFLLGIGFFAGNSLSDNQPTNTTVQCDTTQTPVQIDTTHKKLPILWPLMSWNNCTDCVREKILDYLKAITSDTNSNDYVKPEDRIATFDMDGTFLTEKPFSMDFLVTKYQIDSVLKDPVLGKQINKIIKDYPTGDFDEKTYAKLDILKKKAFGGVSEDSIAETAYKFMTTGAYDTKKFPNFKNGELFYVPMLELFQHLQKYDFKIFVVSGSDRSILWGCIKALKEVYPSYKFQLDRIQLIGSDWNLKAKKMTSKNSDYIFQKEDEVVRDTSMLATSIKMQKVINIYRQIGKYPVFSGGNTDGDFSMLNMALRDTTKKRMSIIIWHDDDSREYAYNQKEDWANKVKQYGWTLVSMKKEFNSIYIK